jgi:hypothetical protein
MCWVVCGGMLRCPRMVPLSRGLRRWRQRGQCIHSWLAIVVMHDISTKILWRRQIAIPRSQSCEGGVGPRGCCRLGAPESFRMRLSSELQQSLSFLDLLNGTWEFETSDQRDYLYAMYGMAKEICDVVCLPEELKPNYEKSPEEVEANFTRWLINNTRSLDILSFLRSTKTLDGSPLKKT